MKSLSLIVLASVSSAAAFQATHPQRYIARYAAMKPLRNAPELSPIDEMCIENVAEFCLHESCDLEEYEALINQLEEQRDHFITHVANVESLLHRLKDSNHPEHDPEEVQELIQGIKSTLANPPQIVNGGTSP